MIKYRELRKRQQKEFETLPLHFAFGQKQLDQMLRGCGLDPKEDLDKIISIGAGGYILPKDVPLLIQMSARHKKEMSEAIAADKSGEGFVFEMFFSELMDHEFVYTGDPSDALEALGYTKAKVLADPRLKRGFEKAVAKIYRSDLGMG